MRVSTLLFACLSVALILTDSAGAETWIRTAAATATAQGESSNTVKKRLGTRAKKEQQRIEAALDAMTPPRAMTALASQAGDVPEAGRKLADWVDPAQMRNWAEFVDPALSLRRHALADTPPLSHSVFRYAESGASGQPAANWHWPFFRPDQGLSPVSTTWRSVILEGAKRSLNGQQAIQEWLMLPMPDPRANPWLTGQATTRY